MDVCEYSELTKCEGVSVQVTKSTSTAPNSEQCRLRSAAEVAKTEGGQKKLQKVSDKSDRDYAEQIS